MFPTGIANVYVAVASGLLLCAILIARRAAIGKVIILVVSLIAVTTPVLHTRGTGVGASAKSSAGFFFVRTLIALGMTGTFTFILSVRALLSPQAGQAQN
jgi:hypothetical protein